MVTKEQIVKLVQENDKALFRAMPHFAGAAVHPFVHGVAKQYMKSQRLSLKQIVALRKFLKNVKNNPQIDVLYAAALKKEAGAVEAKKKEEADKQLDLNFDGEVASWIELKNQFAQREAEQERQAYQSKLDAGW